MSVLAYLDPGSGSLILQAILGGIAALGVTAKLWWGRLMRLLRIRRDEPVRTEDSPEPSATTGRQAESR